MRSDEKLFLAYVAATLPQGSLIVEVGTYTGGSANLLGLASEGRARVVSIDTNKPEDLSLLDQVGAEFFLGDAESYRAARSEPIDLLFIDGDHSFSGVRLDYERLAPLVRPGGIVAVHDFDINHLGVKLFCDGLLRAGCLEQWRCTQRLLVGRPVQGRPIPTADHYVDAIDRFMQVYDKSEYCKGWRKRDQPLENFLYDFPTKLENVYFVRGSVRCRFLIPFFDLPLSRFISADQASDPTAKYYLCGYDTERTFETLRVHKKIPAHNVSSLNDFLVSMHIMRDILDNKGEKCLRMARNELEREIIEKAFLRLPEARVYRLHELGFLHYFFYNLGDIY
jgi:hypothetical protein